MAVMQLSIWREFSSNNSARFTVVGVFETPEGAREAEGRLNGLLAQIRQWYEQPENAQAAADLIDGGLQPPSPPEVRLARDLGIEWGEYALDWLDYRGGPVFAFERLLFVDGTDSWMGAKPADALVQKFGGMAFVDGTLTSESYASATVLLNLTCTAPDEATAIAIQHATANYLQPVRSPGGAEMFDTPWRDFARPGLFSAYSTFQGRIQREGRRLRFERGQFFHIADGLPALITYLKHHGCTEISYTFTEEVEAWADAPAC